MSSSAKVEIPDIISDFNTKTSYIRGRFFGKGGFAQCYEITDSKTKQVYAGKIVSKQMLLKDNQREKMAQEIQIHKSLNHINIVGFHSFFEDKENIYIVLELCKKRSMMELHRRRKTITEPETRFYIKQILNGVDYLHKNKIIHRDLKLGNIFLNDELHVKIGDFGLSTKIEFDGERKKTLCGTPNYIAPEILNKKGHSFEVDVWSIGCIMYTLLVGKPPFETGTLKDTYVKIKRCDYRVPSTLPDSAKKMIMRMLQPDPGSRAKISELLMDNFLKNGYIPKSLPVSCLTTVPRFDDIPKMYSPSKNQQRKPLIERNNFVNELVNVNSPLASGSNKYYPEKNFDIKYLMQLRDQLVKLLKKKPGRENGYFGDEMSDPAAQPLVWVSKWVDYSDKYGFGYQLCDDSVGVMFNDNTKIILLSNGITVHYIDKDDVETYMQFNQYPPHLEKKIKLLSYFIRYMKEHLLKAGDEQAIRESDKLSRIPYLNMWIRSSTSVAMHLTNGTLQINFIDHTKLIMCPLMAAVTYIDEEKNFRTFRFQTIEEHGCSMQLQNNLKYAYDKVNVLLNQAHK